MRRVLCLILGLLASLAAPAAHAADFRLLVIGGHYLKWGAPKLRSGASVSYGLATDRQSFPDAVNCGELAPMRGLSKAWGDDDARLERIVAAAFRMWSAGADLDFRPARTGERPDILIGAQGKPRRIAFANVWHDPAKASGGIAPLVRATICLNPVLPWGASGSPSAATGLDLGTVLAHEIGHTIGLDHPGATGALMAYQNQGGIDRLMSGDIAGAVALYGPPAAD